MTEACEAPDAASVEPDGAAVAGAPLPLGVAAASEETIIEALRTVRDPEIPINIYDLGLIYAIDVATEGETRGDVEVLMTLTAPACPVAGEMPQQAAETVAGVEGVGRVRVRLTWEPPWTPDRMSDVARVALDMF